MFFSPTTKKKSIAALIICAVHQIGFTAESSPTFNALMVKGVPDVRIVYDEVAQLRLPTDDALAKLLTTQISDGVLLLSCTHQCERLRDVSIEVAVPMLLAVHAQNGGRIRVQSSFPLTKYLNVRLSNGGDIDAVKLPALDSMVTIENGGNVQLTTCDSVRAELNNGGEIVFDGAAVVDAKRRNGGEVRQRNKAPMACQHMMDSRDQHRYATVTIGEQEWFAENLAWLPRVCALADSNCGIWVYGHDNNHVDTARSTPHFQRFGALYSWHSAQQACPQGWRLPSDHDWQKLEASLGMPTDELDKTIWRGPPLAASMKAGGGSQLQILLPGWRSGDGRFMFVGEHANFWTASPAHEHHAIERLIGRSKPQIGRHTGNMSCGFSVRCVRDDDLKKP